jgi:hypothetical protein
MSRRSVVPALLAASILLALSNPAASIGITGTPMPTGETAMFRGNARHSGH